MLCRAVLSAAELSCAEHHGCCGGAGGLSPVLSIITSYTALIGDGKQHCYGKNCMQLPREAVLLCLNHTLHLPRLSQDGKSPVPHSALQFFKCLPTHLHAAASNKAQQALATKGGVVPAELNPGAASTDGIEGRRAEFGHCAHQRCGCLRGPGTCEHADNICVTTVCI